MKKHPIAALTLALALTAGLSLPVQAAEITFSDIPQDHWAVESVARMADRGVMTGVGDNRFAPDKTITYAEFITMVVRQFYEDKIGGGGDTWYAPYMSVAETIGILTGTNVSAEATINRYDMAQIMYNVMKEQKMSTSSLSDTSKVADWASVPAAYQDAVSVCYNMGMLSGVDGNGTFNGTGVMTRAQAAVVMDRLIGDEQVAPPDVPVVQDGVRKVLTGNDVTFSDSKDSYKDGVFHFPHDKASEDLTGRCVTYVVIDVAGYDYITVRNADTAVALLSGDTALVSVAKGTLSCDVKDLTSVVLKVSTPETRTGDIDSIILGTYAVVQNSIPDGAYALTNSNTKLIDTVYEDGKFVLDGGGAVSTGSFIKFSNPGHSTLTFTVTGRSYDQIVGVSDTSGMEGTRIFEKSLSPGETETFTVDISGVRDMTLSIRNGRQSDATIYNMYLS